MMSRIILTLLFTFFYFFGTVQSAGFLDSCDNNNSSLRCDPKKQLACSVNNVCGCRIPDSMHYEPDLDACVVKAGKLGCVSSVSDGSLFHAACTSDAYCDTTEDDKEGNCLCIRSFYEDTGRCKRGHGAPCNSSAPCFPSFNLFCDGYEKRCSCNKGQDWDVSRKKCLKLSGQPCQSDEECSINSICPSVQPGAKCQCKPSYAEENGKCKGLRGTDCTTSEHCNLRFNLYCANNTCSCNTGTQPVEDGKCEKGLGTPCTRDNDCPFTYSCLPVANGVESVCSCNANTRYDNGTRKCLVLVNRECSKDYYEYPCDDFATCEREIYDDEKTCVCSSGYLAMDDFCKGSHGKACKSNQHCRSDLRLICTKNLKCDCDFGYEKDGEACRGKFETSCKKDDDCISGRCRNKTCACPLGSFQDGQECKQCKPDTVSDPSYLDGVCLQGVGAACNSGSECGNNADCADMKNNKTCTCKVGFQPDNVSSVVGEGHVCRAIYGNSCKTNADCHHSSPTCTNGVCTCGEGEVYDDVKRKCLKLPGQICQKEQADVCVPHSHCNQEGICECDTNYGPDVAGCTGLHNATCEVNVDCHSSSHLTCGKERFCQCKEGFVFSNGRCLVNPCFKNNTCQCPPGSVFNDKDQVCSALYNAGCPTDQYDCNTEFNLECQNGKCNCKVNTIRDENYEKDRCLLKAGQECTQNGECVQNSECSYLHPGESKTCNCIRGSYRPNEAGLCIPVSSYGEQCQVSTDCHPDFPLCRQQKCKCKDGQKFYPAKRKCFIEVGSNCYRDKEKCYGNSACDKENVCKCILGYAEDQSMEGKVCKRVFGGSCQRDVECSSSSLLICRQGLCSCKEGTEKDSSNKCRALVGSVCHTDSQCVEKAVCNKGKCTCRQNVAVLQGHCVSEQEGSKGYRIIGSGILMMIIAVLIFV